jgi:hypothetical protein
MPESSYFTLPDDAEGTNVSIAVAAVDPVVCVTVIDPPPICKDSEKYKSNFVSRFVSQTPFTGEYGMLSVPVNIVGVPVFTAPLPEHELDPEPAFSVVKEKVAAVFMTTSVVDDALYALKQLLGTVSFCECSAFNPPVLLIGTSTTLLNQRALN